MNTRPTPSAPFRPSRFAPAPLPDGMRSTVPTCARCGAEIAFIRMEKSGKLMPVDPEQRYGDGRRHLVQRVTAGPKVLGRMVLRAGPDVLGLEPHWGTCNATSNAH